MRVYVKLLGTYREHLPPDAQRAVYPVEVPDSIPIGALLARADVPAGEGDVVLVNGRTPVDGQVLEEGDTVTLFPAMAGG